MTSAPLHTVELRELTMTVIRVDNNGRDTYQLYAVDDTGWALTGIFGLFMDALAELRRWRRYIAAGGTLAAFAAAHPEGIRPDHQRWRHMKASVFERVRRWAIIGNAGLLIAGLAVDGDEELLEDCHDAFVAFFAVELLIRLRHGLDSSEADGIVSTR
jgi:hypothetical protein